MNNVEVVALIYKSVKYLDFIMDQLSKEWNAVPGWNVGVRIVGNDPTVEVMDHLKKSGFRYSEYRDAHPTHWYLDRVYRAWNWCVATSDFENVCLVNSDMAFSPGWLESLLKHHDGVNIPCSRLVESGRLTSAEPHTISNNFGRHPSEFRQQEWTDYANSIKQDKIEEGGTYMPCVFNRQRFMDAGGYPEGNLYKVGPDVWEAGWKGRAGNPPDSKSGDFHFMREKMAEKYGMKHITVFDSLCYHFQEGEKSE